MKKNKQSTSQLNPSLSRVRKLLSEVAFNPRTPGVLNVITNAGNPHYFEMRALEFISEAQITRTIPIMRKDGQVLKETIQETMYVNYKEEMISAIRMLVIAILKVEDGEV